MQCNECMCVVYTTSVKAFLDISKVTNSQIFTEQSVYQSFMLNSICLRDIQQFNSFLYWADNVYCVNVCAHSTYDDNDYLKLENYINYAKI